MVTATIVAMALALVLGGIANTLVGPRASSDAQAIKTDLLVSPLLTLTALLLAFVLVQVFSSHNRARLSAGEEAGAVIGEYRLFELLPDEYAQPAHAALICYARSVSEIEWPMLRERMKIAPQPNEWADRVGAVLLRLANDRTEQPFGAIVTTDRERLNARRRRVMESRPAVPEAVSWLMLGVSAIAVFSIAAFTLGPVARRLQWGALVLLTCVFGSVQLAIVEIDSKYEGVIRVEPEEMRLMAGLLQARFAASYPHRDLPCDAQGEPSP